jgi:hypothetical protein
MLVILAALVPAGAVQIKRTVNFNSGTTRSQIYDWALEESGITSQLRQGEYSITFFYCEPDEVTA